MRAHPARHTKISIQVEGSPVYSAPQERQSKPIVTDQRRRAHFNTGTEPDGVFMCIKSKVRVDDWTVLSFRVTGWDVKASRKDYHSDALNLINRREQKIFHFYSMKYKL